MKGANQLCGTVRNFKGVRRKKTAGSLASMYEFW